MVDKVDNIHGLAGVGRSRLPGCLRSMGQPKTCWRIEIHLNGRRRWSFWGGKLKFGMLALVCEVSQTNTSLPNLGHRWNYLCKICFKFMHSYFHQIITQCLLVAHQKNPCYLILEQEWKLCGPYWVFWFVTFSSLTRSRWFPCYEYFEYFSHCCSIHWGKWTLN
jgi:hypothetical protein